MLNKTKKKTKKERVHKTLKLEQDEYLKEKKIRKHEVKRIKQNKE